MQAATTNRAWCGNLHQAQQVATQGVQWFFGCLPCVRGHHRIHPTTLESSDPEYILVDSKKRLRVLHIIPDSTNSINIKLNCQSDPRDQNSLEGSEDYWFMRWNRPIRQNFNRNSCNCSFRRSQTKSIPDLKEHQLEENKENLRSDSVHNNGSLDLEDGIDKSLDYYAEKLSHSILAAAISSSFEARCGINGILHAPLRDFKNGEKFPKCCDNVCVENVNVTIGESSREFGGYVNPVFLSSNDSLNLIPTEDKKNSCTHEFIETGILTTSQEDTFMKENQDYNANDQHVMKRVNSCKKQSPNTLKPISGDNSLKKKHRKSCLVGSKAHLQKPLLLLIHGAGSNCEIWRNLISHLVLGGYECLAPDLLGHGLSSAPDSASLYTFHAFLQDLLCIFDRFVVEGRSAVILGHGYGCSMAAAIARYRPEQVIQLVLISGGGPTPLAPRTQPSVSPCLRACLEPLLMCGFKRDVVYSVCGKQMEPISPEASGVPRHIVEHIAQGHVWPEGDAAFHRRIVAPTLLVHGMKDQHITLVQQCEMERTIPRSFLEVIPEAGHWAMLETPSHLGHMILCFIDWWAPPNRTQ